MPASSQGSFGLPSRQRIKESREFAGIKAKGRRFSLGCLVLNWALGTDQRAPRLGVVVSRKVGCAVVRNRAKRLIRESFRLNQASLPRSLRLILVARPSIAGKTLAHVQRDLLSALRQTRLLVTTPVEGVAPQTPAPERPQDHA